MFRTKTLRIFFVRQKISSKLDIIRLNELIGFVNSSLVVQFARLVFYT